MTIIKYLMHVFYKYKQDVVCLLSKEKDNKLQKEYRAHARPAQAKSRRASSEKGGMMPGITYHPKKQETKRLIIATESKKNDM